MKINDINFSNDGYVNCKSCFYTVKDILQDNKEFNFQIGINKLTGEIDSGVWAISYLLSMYNFAPKSDITIFQNATISVNKNIISLKEFSKYSCYLDKEFPLFSSDNTIEHLVKKGIKKNKLNYTADEIKNLFQITDFRFKRPVSKVGNEKFKAMAAIGYAHGKQVYCFPWLSQNRFDGYHNNLTCLLSILKKLETIVILPMGNPPPIFNNKNYGTQETNLLFE